MTFSLLYLGRLNIRPVRVHALADNELSVVHGKNCLRKRRYHRERKKKLEGCQGKTCQASVTLTLDLPESNLQIAHRHI